MKLDEMLNNVVIKIEDFRSDMEVTNNPMEVILPYIDLFGSIADQANTLNSSQVDVLELNDKLNLLLTALKAKDYDLLSDIMEYEMKPLLEHWLSFLH